jgi:hypothetical protein
MAEDIKNNNGAEEEIKDNNSEPKTTYTKEEVDELLQKEVDRRINSAYKKWAQQSKKEIENARKLAELDEQERAAYELRTAKEELEKLKKEKAMAENTQATLRVLANRNLPSELLDYVLTEDEESTLEKIVDIEKILKKWVDAEVTKRIPTQGTPKSGTSISKDIKSLANLKLAEINQLQQSDPELFKQLAGK